MDGEHLISRRTGLKNLGAMGAAVALSGAAIVQKPAGPAPARQPGDAAEVAVDRMAKGHS